MSGRVIFMDWEEVARTYNKICPLPADAYTEGTRVVKSKMGPPEDNDLHQLGATGTVKAAVNHPELGLAYFLEWDDMKGATRFSIGWKLQKVTTS